MHNSKQLVIRALPLMIAAAYGMNAAAEERLEEVIVTAQKRAERMQDVPISISAITAAQLETRGIEGARNIDGLVPNVSVKSSPGAGLVAALSIRGLTSSQPAIWADPGVGIYMDGIFIGKNQGALIDVADLERVEVLRGPQGTLFGRNTEGGAINFITRKPSGEFTGSVGLEVGNYGRMVERISVDLPKMGALSLGVAYRNEEQDGTVGNPNGKAWNSRGRQALRLTAGLEVTSKLKLNYAFDRSNINETPPAVQLIDRTGYSKIFGSPTYGFFQAGIGNAIAPYVAQGYQSSVAGDPSNNNYQKLEIYGHALIAEYDVSEGNVLKYIGSTRGMRYRNRVDLDGTPLNVYTSNPDNHYNTYSHEFQWIHSSEKLNTVVGYYQFRDDGNSLGKGSGSFFTFNPLATGYRLGWYRVTTNAKAIFGQVDYKFTDALTGTLGVRRTSEDKGGAIQRYFANSSFVPTAVQPGYGYQQQAASFSATTPVIALAYRFNDSINVFGRMAKGFKSGGFPLEANNVPGVNGGPTTGPMIPFQPEKSTSYELGMKTNFWDNRAQVNVTVFRTDVSNFQVSLLPAGGTSPTMVNAGKLKTQGLELETVFLIADGWRLQANYGYLDAKFDEYFGYNRFSQWVNGASNTVVGYAPKQQINLSLDGRLAKTSYGILRGIVDVNYSDKYYTYAGQKDPNAPNAIVGNTAIESEMPSLTTVNAKLLLTGVKVGGPGQADISFWVRNLTDQKKMNNQIDLAGYLRIGMFTDPRTYGMTFNYKW
ncbi:MAG: TonB-dependent receptor [Proteobacteria bacterium]|nr:TonB-dependent receptor [Pseudomonadota bacterium]HQR04810.1 TonB-dependent receptor [Rhodocyclaceae bacterium]